MRSSDGARDTVLAGALVLVAAVAIATVRPALAARYHRLRVTSDVYALGNPEHVVVASLGYRSALADYLFANLLVSYGLHFQEKRRLEFTGEYLDTINALDPKFRDPYRFADTLLVLSPEPPRLSDYVKAREVLERGLRNRPFDTDLWNTAGQFLAFLAWPYLPDSLKPEWKRSGGKMLARACELASNNVNIPYNCVVAATLLDASFEREAAIESLRRLLAVTDDPEIENLALRYLGKRIGERQLDQAQKRRLAFQELWQHDLPFVSKDMLLLMGPPVNVARCAGAEHAGEPACATSFREWGRMTDSDER